jgi:D-amino-acid oxidase
LAPHEVPDGFRSALEVTVPVADTRRYLPWLLERVRTLGGSVHVRAVASLSQLIESATLDRRAMKTIVNCSGLGARELCGDQSLVPIRGQVLVARGIELQRGIIDDTGERPVYAIPRSNEVILGGTAQRGDARRASDPRDSESILAGLQRHVPGLSARDVADVKVGLRPWRPSIRLEREQLVHGIALVHNYGHGGSGYTVAWGCAREAAALALASRQ